MSGSQWVFSPKFPQEAIEQLLGLLGRSKIGRETQDIFVKLTEEARRERLRRLDAGLHTLDDIGWLSHLSLEFFFWGGVMIQKNRSQFCCLWIKFVGKKPATFPALSL